ncbi:NAD(P)-dependent dehydrogenase, short-chain alcohol dehydrogenase family [Pustulibacterium marinum]|uniref:NAD(P)-dependent dehydrogenase, short-chain alcohol dehydrogenase family n=1 Tax=Pustulibacterium marinum TaxID=1224947 RepID=A0A1I7I999_9FLAO|nr:NAD(P)-dependent dehydrogenase, short-chain alcohol dehydrogenase family [Pustulibacterium marinum]
MELLFKNKVALVTGAASGLGLETARQFAESGASVVLADFNQQALDEAVKLLLDKGYDVIGIKCDVSSEAEVKNMVEQVIQKFGKLDIAYNNAGMHVAVAETADALSEDFDRAIAVNLKGIWLCMKYELQQMREQGSGSIVNCSSQSGIVGTANLGAYTAAKHGVVGLTKATALEYAPKGIRVNCICPGTTDTPMVAYAIADHPEHMDAIISSIPKGRMGKSEELASTVLWLSSDAAGFMIGQAVVPDGGYTIK